MEESIELAGLLGVQRIVPMSGLSAGHPGATAPNWAVNPWTVPTWTFSTMNGN